MKMGSPAKTSYEIKFLKEFLKKCLKVEVLDYNLKCLTKPGDNYGGVIQSLDVKITNERDENGKLIHLVCKSAVTNPFLIEIFQPEVTFVKENQFYSDIIPAIEQFEEDLGILPDQKLDAFIKCIGCRISLNPETATADADALLILENVKMSQYKNEDRHIGFDAETAFVVLNQLGQFHALCIALRLLRPEIFKAKILPHLSAIPLNKNPGDTRVADNVCNGLHHLEALEPQLLQKIESQLYNCDRLTRNTDREADTWYTTVVHRDLWVNNIMILRDADAKPTKIKIYDFQLYFYHSFVCDLIFFLFTSVRNDDLKKNFHTFVRRYYERFVDTLKMVNCPLDNYTFDKIWHEIKAKAKYELLHILWHTKICGADETKMPPMEEISPDTFFKDEPPSEFELNRWKLIIELFEENGFI